MHESFSGIKDKHTWGSCKIKKLAENLTLILKSRIHGDMTSILGFPNSTDNNDALVAWIDAEFQTSEVAEDEAIGYCLKKLQQKLTWEAYL